MHWKWTANASLVADNLEGKMKGREAKKRGYLGAQAAETEDSAADQGRSWFGEVPLCSFLGASLG